MTASKRELIKKELNSYRNDLQNLERRKIHCAFNSMAFIVQSGFNYDHLYITGHSACINSTTIVDPTVGCAWLYNNNPIEKIRSILLYKTTPDIKTEWFEEGRLNYFWNYNFKLTENLHQKTLPRNWDIPIQITIGSFKGKETITIGKYSDYVQNKLVKS